MEKEYEVVDKNRELEYYFGDLIGKKVIITGEVDEVTGKYPIKVVDADLRYRNLKILKKYLVEL